MKSRLLMLMILLMLSVSFVRAAETSGEAQESAPPAEQSETKDTEAEEEPDCE